MPTVELRFTPLPAHVRTARLLAAVLARRAGVDEALIDEVKLAVGEACARAVRIHQRHTPADDVVVELSDDEGFVVVVRDCGPHDADTADGDDPVPDLPDVPELDAVGDLGDAAPGDGGLPPGFGLAVIAGLVEDLAVDPQAQGTTVRMAWVPVATG
jgi:anti-sigma regulatory factor (Ser/Thr protein kinase)